MRASDLTFFTNEPNRTLADRFKAILKAGTQYLDILVGFFRLSGFYLIHDALDEVEKTRVIVGISTDKKTYEAWEQAQKSLNLSSAEAIKDFKSSAMADVEEAEERAEVEEGILRFMELVKSGKLEIRVYPKHPIHAKVYIIRKNPEKSEDFGKVITGSSNFTYSGLVDNLEFNVELKNRADVEYALEKFEQLWKESIPLNKDFVEEIKNNTHKQNPASFSRKPQAHRYNIHSDERLRPEEDREKVADRMGKEGRVQSQREGQKFQEVRLGDVPLPFG